MLRVPGSHSLRRARVLIQLMVTKEEPLVSAQPPAVVHRLKGDAGFLLLGKLGDSQCTWHVVRGHSHPLLEQEEGGRDRQHIAENADACQERQREACTPSAEADTRTLPH